MPTYRCGLILTRCFLQAPLQLSAGVVAAPLSATGSAGFLHDARRLLDGSARFSKKNLDAALANFAQTGASVVVTLPEFGAEDWIRAVDAAAMHLPAVAGALAVVSANAVVPVCAFAQSQGGDGGVNFFIPNDRQIRHATNVGGFRDAAAALYERARADSKLELLLRLYRASLREPDVDHQILFQLILLEEASDAEGGTLAERMTKLVEGHNLQGDLEAIINECALTLPAGRTVVNLLVELRNAAAHNGRIDETTLRDWAVPLVSDKAKLHKAVSEMIRCLLCALVGRGRNQTATLVHLEPGQAFKISFD